MNARARRRPPHREPGTPAGGRTIAHGIGEPLERYRGLVENAIEGIFQTTPGGRYLMANPMLARLYGYSTPDELIRSLTDIARQLYVDPGRRDVFMHLLQENGQVQGFESQVYRRDGTVIWISESARAVRGAGGRLLGFEGTVVDITWRKQAEAERAEAVAALERAHAELEIRVRERTAELVEANGALRAEVAERRRTEQDLAAAHSELAAAEAEKKRFYREVIRCVTRDKFHLVEAAEIPDPGALLLERTLASFEDDPRLRRDLREAVRQAGMDRDAVEDLVLAVGEAVTNAVKHAGGGWCGVYRRAGGLVVRVSDRGTGIHADTLPASILQPGFSRAASLGMGYTLMLEMVDRIWLATERDGTVVQLEKRFGPEEKIEVSESLAAHLLAAWDRL